MEVSPQAGFVTETIDRYADMVVRVAYQNLKSKEDAEDIAQEVFIKLLKQRVFNGDEHVKAWLLRVTVNLCKNHRRMLWRHKPPPVMEEWAEFSDEEQRVLDLIWSLKATYRNVIYLYYYEGYTTTEIANILKMNEKTVWSRLSRGREKLKDILLGNCEIRG